MSQSQPPEMPTGVLREIEAECSSPPERLLAAVTAVAEGWGAEWSPPVDRAAVGCLLLPVVAGLRRGHLLADVEFAPDGRILIRVRAEDLRLNRAAVVVLCLSALAAGVTFLWPFAPSLLPALPVAALLALSGWFLVIQRLRMSGVEEFLAAVLMDLEDGEVEGRAAPETGA